MRQYQGRRIVLQTTPDHFARVDRCAIYGAAEKLFKRHHSVFVIEKQAGKDFVGVATQFGQEEASGVLRPCQ